MFCHSCGSKQLEESQFCPKCGTKIVKIDQIASTEEVSPQLESEIIEPKAQQKNTWAIWLLPVISLLLIIVGLTSIYFYEVGKSKTATIQLEHAHLAIMDGNYEEAYGHLIKANQSRPKNDTISKLTIMVEEVLGYEQTLLEVDQFLQKNELEQASDRVSLLNDQIVNLTNSFYEPFLNKVKDREMTLTVAKLKNELNELTTIDALVEKLNSVSSFDNEEARAIKEQIINKIVNVSYDQAKVHLDQNQFSDAIRILDRGLEFASNHEKLLSFKEKVSADKQVFEQAELQRIEKAMVAAAEEDLRNRTAAVEILSINTVLDEYGDIYFSGEVKNKATTPISSVEIYYSVYSLNGEYYGQSSTTVYPYYLEPGEVGSFSEWFYSIYEDVDVTINNITWYLN